MEFFNSAVDVLKTLVVALGAGLGVWGAVNLMEGYGGDNPSANAHMQNFMRTYQRDFSRRNVFKCLQIATTKNRLN